MTTKKHTLVPWVVHIIKDGGEWEYQIRTAAPHNPAGGLGKHIATVNGLMQAKGEDNAAFIVLACNAHDDLLEACKAVLARLDLEPDGAIFPCSAQREMLRAAITKAQGGEA